MPPPTVRFANFQEGRRTVHRDGHVKIGRAYYFGASGTRSAHATPLAAAARAARTRAI